MQLGIDSFAASIADPVTGVALTPAERMHHLLEEIALADQVGLDVFGIGEHHRAEFLDSAPPVILAAGAALTKTYSAYQRGHGAERSRSGACFSAVRNP